MSEVNAIILDQPGSEAARKIGRVLEFFGVKSRVVGVDALTSEISERSGSSHNRVLGTAEGFLELAKGLEGDDGKRILFVNDYESAFCCINGEGGGQRLVELARGLGLKTFAWVEEGGGIWNCSETLKEFTGAMAGVSVQVVPGQAGWVCRGAKAEDIISNPAGAAFLKVDFYGVPLFLSTSEVIDLDAPLPARSFDVRPHFLSAVPVVLYVKSAFARMCWQHPETGACVVMDDPLLRPRYGFLDYERMLGLMERLDFSTNVAFIPWNRNRSSQETVRLFREHPGRFSLSVHGCDHTKAEYGSGNREWLAWKSHQSLERMAEHRRQTELPYDPVMVFPQGIFSEAAMAVLKRGNFIGAVNSEVISADPEPRTITIGDFWDVAVMSYSDFPIFTRRYPWAGVENFAFDILLGKPCLLNIHHNDCHDDYQCVTECITQLNRLNARLHWTNLTEVVRRSYRQRATADGGMEVEIYGSEVRLENPTGEKKLFRVSKRESTPDGIQDILADGQPVKWSSAEKRVAFEIELEPGAGRIVHIAYRTLPVAENRDEGWYYQARVRARRYLSEWRDNVLMRKSFSE